MNDLYQMNPQVKAPLEFENRDTDRILVPSPVSHYWDGCYKWHRFFSAFVFDLIVIMNMIILN